MELKGKALFNLLRINWLENKTIDVSAWHVEDLRDLSIEELFSRLKTLGLILNEESFYLYAENCESPEELLDFLWIEDENLEGRERTYLLIFELWRRLLPDKFSLSIFCDELDQLFELYDADELADDETLQNALQILEDVLDDAADAKGDPKQVFKDISLYCAHDLERFIADYIFDQISAENTTYASELFDEFFPYISNRRRFEFLRALLITATDVEEANLMYTRILGELEEQPDLELLLQITESLTHHGDVRLFMHAVKQALPLLTTEEEFQNLLAMVAEYYRCLDRDKEEKSVKSLLDARSAFPLDRKLESHDPTFLHFIKLIS